VGSHADEIVIENSAGGNDWGKVVLSGFPQGRSQIGAYTIPLGMTGVIHSVDLTVDSSKPIDVLFFSRSGILATSAPYKAMQVRREMKAVTGNVENLFIFPIGPMPALTDIGVMAKGATNSDISVDFTIELIAD